MPNWKDISTQSQTTPQNSCKNEQVVHVFLGTTVSKDRQPGISAEKADTSKRAWGHIRPGKKLVVAVLIIQALWLVIGFSGLSGN